MMRCTRRADAHRASANTQPHRSMSPEVSVESDPSRRARYGLESVSRAFVGRLPSHRPNCASLKIVPVCRNRLEGLIRYRVAVASRVGRGEAVAGLRVDHHHRSRARHAELPQVADVMAAGLQLPVNRLQHVGFDRKLVESRRVRRESAVEMHRLQTGPLEGGVQVGISPPHRHKSRARGGAAARPNQ